MATLFTVELTIHMTDGGRLAKQLLNLYFSDMAADINATALKLCDSNEGVQARKFGKLNLKRADVWPGDQGGLKIFALIAVTGEDAAFIKQVIAGYMDGFAGYLKKAGDGYFSRTSFPPDISLQPSDWSVEFR
jgi:hypothetical protein